MNDTVTELVEHIRTLEERLEQEFERRRELYGARFKGKLTEWQQELVAKHRQLRMSLPRFLFSSDLATVLVSPVIYSMIVPLALVDFWATLYQHICFRVYGIPRVCRADYVALDRQHLAYLNLIEKINCVYCGYGNGVAAYVREIASRTEQYWCPIKHARRISDPHKRYLTFLDYGDAEGYREKRKEFRKNIT